MAVKTFPYAVKHDGIWYKPGEKIEILDRAETAKLENEEVKRTSGRRKAEATDKPGMRKTK